MAKAILNSVVERFVSKKLLCLIIGIVLELSGVGISDNLLYLCIAYLGSQGLVDTFAKWKQAK